ncbi:protein-tyrosine phosphatase family protein [Aquisphaera insulae]|uniref:protein-tyrosine phosphatase family protein n=1 Tax=Aquisphaera insulae TaxID=2712864 RepID=UPI0013ED750B|nr:dual specificity protein phosphatase family protein [Aquisphaera insulae]
MRRIAGYPLWLGHAGDARDVAGLHEAGLGAVVELAIDEPPASLPRDMIHARFPLIDGAGNPPWLLRAAVELVVLLLRADVPTLVCCGAGLSRTPAVAGVAIALVRGCSPEDGLAIVTRNGPADIAPGLWTELRSAIVGKAGEESLEGGC